MFLNGTNEGDEMRDNLKRIREKRRMTQSQLAQKVGIARTTYTNIKLGIKNPSFNVAIKIKKVLGVKGDDIFLVSLVPERNNNTTKTA